MIGMWLAVAVVAAEAIVPGSTSPDGKWYLAVATSARAQYPPAPLILHRGEKAFLLEPGEDPVGDRSMLHGGIQDRVMPGKEPEFRDFEYSVTWSPDSRYFAIDGGAHKFWAWVVYSVETGEPQLCQLPAAQEVATTAREAPQSMRATELAESEPFVRAVRPGAFALHAHPFTCCDASLEDVHVYVLVDFANGCTGRVVGVEKIEAR